MGTITLIAVIFTLLSMNYVVLVNSDESVGVQRFVKVPESVTVMEGESVTLTCRVENILGLLQWTKDDFGLGTARPLPGYERYSMLGEDDNTWDLHIHNVQVEDEGLYQCQILASTRSGPLRSDYVTVGVLAKPQPPIITSGPRLVVKDGSNSLVQCISKGSRPETLITWRRNGDILSEGVENKVTTLSDLKTMTVSTLTFSVSSDMSDDILTCEATNHAVDSVESIDTKVIVESKPNIKIEMENDGPIYEGDRVTFICKSDSQPLVTDYSWSLGGKYIKASSGSRTLTVDVNRQMHQSIIICSARNSAGANKAYYKLDINYGPVFREQGRNVTQDNGERIELRCDVDSNPEADLTWYKLPHAEKIIGRGQVLRFALTETTEGGYMCQAEVSGFSGTSTMFHVKPRGPPEIETGGEDKTVSVGDSATVFCQVRRQSPSVTVTWSHEGHIIKPDNEDFSILDTIDGDIFKSVILIRNVEKDHFGEFLCQIENEFGIKKAAIRLEEKASIPKLVIICSGLSACLLIIVIMVVIITCKHSSRSSSSPKHLSPDQYLQITPKALLHQQTPDILYSHSHSVEPPPPQPPHSHSHHGHLNHHHFGQPQHQTENKLVWTVPICTSSVKSDIYSDHENYSYLRGPSFDNYARIEPGFVDLDESSPGTHV